MTKKIIKVTYSKISVLLSPAKLAAFQIRHAYWRKLPKYWDKFDGLIKINSDGNLALIILSEHLTSSILTKVLQRLKKGIGVKNVQVITPDLPVEMTTTQSVIFFEEAGIQKRFEYIGNMGDAIDAFKALYNAPILNTKTLSMYAAAVKGKYTIYDVQAAHYEIKIG